LRHFNCYVFITTRLQVKYPLMRSRQGVNVSLISNCFCPVFQILNEIFASGAFTQCTKKVKENTWKKRTKSQLLKNTLNLRRCNEKPFIVITFGQMQNVYINQMISITSELIFNLKKQNWNKLLTVSILSRLVGIRDEFLSTLYK